MLDTAVTLMLVMTLAAYVWSAKGHFRSDRLEAGAKLIAFMVFASAALMSWLIWTLDQNPVVQVLALLGQLGAFGLFWWAIAATRRAKLLAAFTSSNPQSLVTIGPYRHVRHPFYTSYIVFWFSTALATGIWWVFALPLAMFVIYWRAAAGEEERFAQTAMASDYAAFKRGRARFFPGLF